MTTPPLTLAWPRLAAVALLVLLLHAWLLVALPLGAGTPGRDAPLPMQVRQIVVAAPAAIPVSPPVTPPAQTAPRALRARAEAAPAALPPRALPSEPSPEPSPTPPEAPTEPAAEAPPPPNADAPADAAPAEQLAAASAAPPAPAAAAASAAAPPRGDAPPVYATRLPPAAQLRYELRRGLVSGEGELSWRPGADGYELQIEGRAFGLQLLGQVSRGGIDAAGLAPLRFVDRRRGRDLRAANFRRELGLITYSGSAAEHPLLPGAQDRLSWMLQLAAIVDADPARFSTGQRVVMQVTGARGDADLWTFTVVGRQPQDLPAGRIEGTLGLRREPRKPYDTMVDVWLDPARHHLPVRLRMANAGGDDALEFLLKP